MTSSPLCTEVRPLPSKGSPRSARVSMVVLHHAAMTSLSGLVGVIEGDKTVSAHLAVKDSSIVGLVPEELRAWSLSDAYWDSRALTVETANESTAGWTISAASHESLARIVADWSFRYGFFPHRSGDPESWTVIGHNEVNSIHGGSYGTQCPGAMDLDWIVARAQQLLAPAPVLEEDDMAYKYIWNGVSAPDAKARYALIGVELENGYTESSKLADAKGFSGMSPMPGAPHKLDNEGFDSTLRFARKAREDYLKNRVSIGEVVAKPDPQVAKLLADAVAVSARLAAHLGA